MINFTNSTSNANNVQSSNALSNNSYGNQTNSNFGLQQSPILQILISFIVSILQQMITRLGEQCDSGITEEPDPVDTEDPKALNNLNNNQNANILALHKDLITPAIIENAQKQGLKPYTLSDEDNSGTLSAGDRLLVGSKTDGSFKEQVLTADDVVKINSVGATDSGNPSALANISQQQDANILFLFRDKITPEIIERTKSFAHAYVISDDDNSGSISVGDRLLIGDRIHGDLQEHILTADDLNAINGGALGTNNN